MTTKPVLICGTDFSRGAHASANVAAAMASRIAAKLVLIHVIEQSAEAEELSERAAQLESEANALRVNGLEVEECLVVGRPHDVLITKATEQRAKLVVVGAVGRTAGLFTGSVAQKTAENSPIPTLVVRCGSRIRYWLRGKRPLRVLLGYDFSSAGDAALRSVRQLAQLGPTDLTVFHVDWPPEERQKLGLHGPTSLTRNDPEVQQKLEAELATKTSKVLQELKHKMRVSPGWGRTDTYLTTTAAEINADLLVLGSHQRHGFERFRLGSVSRAVLRNASVSVLIVPKPGATVRAVAAAAPSTPQLQPM